MRFVSSFFDKQPITIIKGKRTLSVFPYLCCIGPNWVAWLRISRKDVYTVSNISTCANGKSFFPVMLCYCQDVLNNVVLYPALGSTNSIDFRGPLCDFLNMNMYFRGRSTVSVPNMDHLLSNRYFSAGRNCLRYPYEQSGESIFSELDNTSVFLSFFEEFIYVRPYELPAVRFNAAIAGPNSNRDKYDLNVFNAGNWFLRDYTINEDRKTKMYKILQQIGEQEISTSKCREYFIFLCQLLYRLQWYVPDKHVMALDLLRKCMFRTMRLGNLKTGVIKKKRASDVLPILLRNYPFLLTVFTGRKSDIITHYLRAYYDKEGSGFNNAKPYKTVLDKRGNVKFQMYNSDSLRGASYDRITSSYVSFDCKRLVKEYVTNSDSPISDEWKTCSWKSFDDTEKPFEDLDFQMFSFFAGASDKLKSHAADILADTVSNVLKDDSVKEAATSSLKGMFYDMYLSMKDTCNETVANAMNKTGELYSAFMEYVKKTLNTIRDALREFFDRSCPTIWTANLGFCLASVFLLIGLILYRREIPTVAKALLGLCFATVIVSEGFILPTMFSTTWEEIINPVKFNMLGTAVSTTMGVVLSLALTCVEPKWASFGSTVVNFSSRLPGVLLSLEEVVGKSIDYVVVALTGKHWLVEKDHVKYYQSFFDDASRFLDDPLIDSRVEICPATTLALKDLAERAKNTMDYLRDVKLPFAENKEAVTLCNTILRMDKVARKLSIFHNSRIETIGCFLKGEPGEGKTFVTPHLAAAVYHVMSKHPKWKTMFPGKFSDTMMYYRTKGSDYWEGYKNHPFAMWNEILAETDPKARAKEILEIMQACESGRYPLNMAFEGKGCTFFTSFIAFLSTNLSDNALEGAVGMTDEGAFYRRRTLNLRVARKVVKGKKVAFTPDTPNFDDCWNFFVDAPSTKKQWEGFKKGTPLGVQDFLAQNIANKKQSCVCMPFSSVVHVLVEELCTRLQKREDEQRAIRTIDYTSYLTTGGRNNCNFQMFSKFSKLFREAQSQGHGVSEDITIAIDRLKQDDTNMNWYWEDTPSVETVPEKILSFWKGFKSSLFADAFESQGEKALFFEEWYSSDPSINIACKTDLQQDTYFKRFQEIKDSLPQLKHYPGKLEIDAYVKEQSEQPFFCGKGFRGLWDKANGVALNILFQASVCEDSKVRKMFQMVIRNSIEYHAIKATYVAQRNVVMKRMKTAIYKFDWLYQRDKELTAIIVCNFLLTPTYVNTYLTIAPAEPMQTYFMMGMTALYAVLFSTKSFQLQRRDLSEDSSDEERFEGFVPCTFSVQLKSILSHVRHCGKEYQLFDYDSSLECTYAKGMQSARYLKKQFTNSKISLWWAVGPLVVGAITAGLATLLYKGYSKSSRFPDPKPIEEIDKEYFGPKYDLYAKGSFPKPKPDFQSMTPDKMNMSHFHPQMDSMQPDKMNMSSHLPSMDSMSVDKMNMGGFQPSMDSLSHDTMNMGVKPPSFDVEFQMPSAQAVSCAKFSQTLVLVFEKFGKTELKGLMTGKRFITYQHYFHVYGQMYLSGYVKGTGDVPRMEFHKEQCRVTLLPGTDLCYMDFLSGISPYMSAKRKLLPNKEALIKFIGDKSFVTRLQVRDNTLMFVRGSGGIGYAPANSPLESVLQNGHRHKVDDYIVFYGSLGEPGDCGDLVVAIDGEGVMWILGIHIAHDGVDSFYAPIYQKDCGSEFQAAYLPPWMESLMDSAPFDQKEYSDADKWGTKAQYIGSLPKPNIIPSKTSFVPSPFQGKLGLDPLYPVTMAPALLNQTDVEVEPGKYVRVRPLHQAWEKVQNSPARPIPKWLWNWWQHSPDAPSQGFFPKINRSFRQWTIEEAVFKNGDWKGLDRTTAIGHDMKAHGFKSRAELWDPETGFIHPVLRELVKELLVAARLGYSLKNVVEACLKDETRDLERVMAGKTRMFFVGSLSILIVTIMVTGDLMTYCKAHRAETDVRIGTNVHGPEWKVLYHRLFSGRSIFAGDFGNYDTSMNEWLGHMYAEDCARKYGYVRGSPEYNAVYSICTSTVGPIVIVGRRVYFLRYLNCSGNWNTGSFNSYVNCVILNSIVYYVSRTCGNPLMYKTAIAEILSKDLYGDDNVGTVDPRFEEEINMVVFAKYIFEFYGMTYTPPSKGAIVSPFVDPEETEFLKRKFRTEGTAVFAPLDRNSITNMLLWIRTNKNTTKEQTLQQNLFQAQIEFFHHGRAVYDEEMKKILEYCPKVGVHFEPFEYDYWLKRWSLGITNNAQ